MKPGLAQALTALAGVAVGSASADVQIIPTSFPGSYTYAPLGCGTSTAPLNHATTHQVFASTLFSSITAGGPITITDIGFACATAGVFNSSITIRMGYTTRLPGEYSPVGLSIPDPAGGGAPNASGPMYPFYANSAYTASIPQPSTSDYGRVHFSGAFAYYPNMGNLLVEIVNDAVFGSTVDLAVTTGWGQSEASFACSSTRQSFTDPSDGIKTRITYTVQTYPTGACCLPDTSCAEGQTQPQCVALNGIYLGHNTRCTSQCPPRGACCRFDGTCIAYITAAACAGQGVFHGVASACGECPTPAPVVHTNCNIETGPYTLTGVPAPVGAVWSEAARDENILLPSANIVAGFNATGARRIADDFTVPAGGLDLAYVHIHAYLVGAAAPSVTAATLRIWNGPPNGGGAVVFGDTGTNRLAHNAFTNIYRAFNTLYATCELGTPPTTTRRLQDVYIAVNQFLPAGVYWLDYGITGATFSPPSTNRDATGRQCDPSDSNGLQLVDGAWMPLTDTGAGCYIEPVNLGAYFRLLGTPGACYPNCDASTAPPCLNIQDFACFLNAFALGASYANCDGSTIVPTLNVQDFGCFLDKFAGGCSSC